MGLNTCETKELMFVQSGGRIGARADVDLANFEIVAESGRSDGCKWMCTVSATGTLFRCEHFGEETTRNAEVGAHGIADSFSVEATGERGDDAAIQQPFEFAQGVLRRDQIEIFLEQGLNQLANPVRLSIFDGGGDDAAGACIELFADGEGGLVCGGHVDGRGAGIICFRRRPGNEIGGRSFFGGC